MAALQTTPSKTTKQSTCPKQTDKQTNKQTSKQANKQTSNQPTNQPTNPPTHQPINQQTHEHACEQTHALNHQQPQSAYQDYKKPERNAARPHPSLDRPRHSDSPTELASFPETLQTRTRRTSYSPQPHTNIYIYIIISAYRATHTLKRPDLQTNSGTGLNTERNSSYPRFRFGRVLQHHQPYPQHSLNAFSVSSCFPLEKHPQNMGHSL